MNGAKIALCSMADDELVSLIRNYGFDLYKDFDEVSPKDVGNIHIILGGGVNQA